MLHRRDIWLFSQPADHGCWVAGSSFGSSVGAASSIDTSVGASSSVGPSVGAASSVDTSAGAGSLVGSSVGPPGSPLGWVPGFILLGTSPEV